MSNLPATEPVRLYVYGIIGPLLAILVGFGVLGPESVSLWLTLAGAVLGVEVARSKAYAPATVDRIRAGDDLVP